MDLSGRRVDLSARRVDLSARRVDLSARRVDLSGRVDLSATGRPALSPTTSTIDRHGWLRL